MTNEEANKYANMATEEYYNWLNSMVELTSEAIFLNYVKNQNYISDLKKTHYAERCINCN